MNAEFVLGLNIGIALGIASWVLVGLVATLMRGGGGGVK